VDSDAFWAETLRDETCAPSTFFAAFHAWAHDDKAIEVYDLNDHEGGGPSRTRRSCAGCGPTSEAAGRAPLRRR
jgi:cephalosporin-C deacetylase-like acetyl esterase